jgi:hypothetical protein
MLLSPKLAFSGIVPFYGKGVLKRLTAILVAKSAV